MEQTFIATAWSNGSHHRSGAGYGLRVSMLDRDRHFRREWETVELRLPALDQPIRVNIDKDSFWSTCRELIHAEVGRWLLKTGAAPWPPMVPPRVLVTPRGEGVFEIRLASTSL